MLMSSTSAKIWAQLSNFNRSYTLYPPFLSFLPPSSSFPYGLASTAPQTHSPLFPQPLWFNTLCSYPSRLCRLLSYTTTTNTPTTSNPPLRSMLLTVESNNIFRPRFAISVCAPPPIPLNPTLKELLMFDRRIIHMGHIVYQNMDFDGKKGIFQHLGPFNGKKHRRIWFQLVEGGCSWLAYCKYLGNGSYGTAMTDTISK